MNKTITTMKRVGAILACLAMLCGVIMSTVALPAIAGETPAPQSSGEVKTFNVNFADLAALATGKYTSGAYASTASDTAINEWVSARFGTFMAQEGSIYKTLTYFGQNTSTFENDGYSGNFQWNILEKGAILMNINKKNGNYLQGGQMMRKSLTLTAKSTNDKYLTLKNFEAEMVFNKAGANKLGSVFISFHEREPGRFNVQESGGKLRYGTDAVIVGNAKTTYSYGGVGTDGIIAGNTATNNNTQVRETFAAALNNTDDYKLTVRVVGTTLTAKVVKVSDSSVVYDNSANPVTITDNEAGYISFGVSNAVHEIKSVKITKLDESGNAIDIDQMSEEEQNAYDSANAVHREIDFTDIPGATYASSKYTASGTYVVEFSQLASTVVETIQKDAQWVFNNGATHILRDVQYSEGSSNKGRYLLYSNNWLQLAGVSINGAHRMTNINALVPRDVNGYRQKVANSVTEFEFRMEDTTRSVLVGIRQDTPGLFVTSDTEINKNQVLIAITKKSIRVAGGDDIKWSDFAIAMDAEYPDDAFGDVFASALQTSGGVNLSVTVKAFDKDIEVVIKNSSSGTQLYKGNFTTDYTAAGYTAIAMANGGGNFGPIKLSKLRTAEYFEDYPKTATNNLVFNDGKTHFVADFQPLADKVINYKNGAYVPSVNDGATNLWFSEKFVLRYNRESIDVERNYIGQSSKELDADGVNSYWLISETGTLVRKTDTVGANMLDQYDAFVLKAPSGLTATMQNFKAEYVVYDTALEKGAVVLSFRSTKRGVIASDSKTVFADQTMVVVGTDKNGDTGVSIVDGRSATTASYTTVDTKVDALKNVEGYKVVVTAIGDKVAVKLVSLDGTETYYTNESAPTTVNNIYNGYVSIGVTNGTKALGYFVLTELNAAGEVVDFGTNTRSAGEKFNLSVEGFVSGDYTFADKVGEAAEADASKIINYLDNKAAIYFNCEGSYYQMEAGLKKAYSTQTSNIGYYGKIISNKWLQRAAVSSKDDLQFFRRITSLVPRSAVTGEELRFTNFEATFDVRFETDRNSVIVGFRQQTPGKFTTKYWALEKEQAFVSISRTGLSIAGGEDIYFAQSNHKPLEGDMYGANATATFTNKLPTEVTVKVRAVGDKVTVSITSLSGSTVYYDNSAAPATVNYTKEGYLAIGIGAETASLADITVARLDAVGEQVDINGGESVEGCPWDTTATRYSESMNKTPAEIAALYDFYFSNGDTYVAKEAMDAHWVLADGVLTRQNDLGGDFMQNLATMMPKKANGEVETFKNFDAVFKVNLDATKKSAFWVIGRQTDKDTYGQLLDGDNYLTDRFAVGVGVGGEVAIVMGETDATIISAPSAGTPTGTYNIRVRVYNRILEVYVNGTLRATRTLPESLVKEGALSFGVGGAESAVTSAYITRLDDNGIAVDYEESEYTGFDTVEPPYAPVGGVLDTTKLPSSITIYKGDAPETSEVFWDAKSVDTSAEGDAYVIGYLKNTNSIRVVQPVYVGMYNRNNTTVYKFESVAELDDFESWYMITTNDVNAPAVHTEGTEDDNWAVKNGVLAYQNNSIVPTVNELKSEEGFTYNDYVYRDDRGHASYAIYHGVAVLKTQKFKNFVLDVDVNVNGRCWTPVGFGLPDYTNPLSVHASQKDSTGHSFHVEFDSTASSRVMYWTYNAETGVANTKNTSTFAGYKETGTNHFRIVVSDGVAMFYVNHGAAPVATITLPETYEGGYIYLSLPKAGTSYDNLKIIDLDKEPVVITQLITDMEDGVVDRELGEEMSALQREVTVADANGAEYVIPSTWISEDFRSDKEGNFTFKMDLSNPWHNFDLSALANESFSVTNKIGNAYDRSNTVKYYFETALELDDFESWYLPTTVLLDTPAIHTEGTDLDNWAIKDGTLVYRKNSLNANAGQLTEGFEYNGFFYQDERSYSGYASNHAIAVLKTQKYENFILDVDVKSSGFWAPIGFGLNTYTDPLGVHAVHTNGGYSFHVEYSDPSSTAKIWGYRESTGTSSMFKTATFPGYSYSGYNHLRIVVSDGVAMYYINYDGAPILTYELPDSYNGGYIYLSLNKENTAYDNLKIVDLDKEEIVITEMLTTVEDITIDREKGEELVLPREITVKDSKGFEYAIAADWSSADYRSWKEGVSTFTLNTDSAWTNINLSALAGTGFTVTNDIGSEYDTGSSRKYYFDHENDLLDFYTQVSQHGYEYTTQDTKGTENPVKVYDKDYHSGYDGVLVPKDGVFRIMNGKVTNTNTATGMGSGWSEMKTMRGVGSAVLKDVNFYNFRLEFDFTHSGMWYTYGLIGVQKDCWTNFYAEANWTEKKYWEQETTDEDTKEKVKAWKESDVSRRYIENGGGTWIFLEQEGNVNIVGAHNSRKARFTTLSNGNPIQGKYDKTIQHHMSITVVDGLVTIEVDNSGEMYYVALNESALGGLVGFANHQNGSTIDNFQITALDAKGDVIDWADAVEGEDTGWAPTPIPDNYLGWKPKDDFVWGKEYEK